MLVLNEAYKPIDRVRSFMWKHVEQERMTKRVCLLGRLIAYLPQRRRAYYDWGLVASYRPAQHLSVSQFSPPHLRLIIMSRWEIGLILGYWTLGLKLGQPLAWFKRVSASPA
jgi:hypothetical protein